MIIISKFLLCNSEKSNPRITNSKSFGFTIGYEALDSNVFTKISDISNVRIEDNNNNILYKLFVVNCQGGRCTRTSKVVTDDSGHSYLISDDVTENRKIIKVGGNYNVPLAELVSCIEEEVEIYVVNRNKIYAQTTSGTFCLVLGNEVELSETEDNLVKIIKNNQLEIIKDIEEDILGNKSLYRLFIVKYRNGDWVREAGEITDSNGFYYKISGTDETTNKQVIIDLKDNCEGKTITKDEVACTEAVNSSKDITNYCIFKDTSDTNNIKYILYGFEEGATENGCKVTGELENNGDNVVRIKSTKEFEIITDSEVATDIASKQVVENENDYILKKLFVVNCNGNGCTRVKRKITDSVGLYYEISATKETENEKLKISIVNNCDDKTFSQSEIACTDNTNSNKDITNYCINTNDNLIYGFEDGATENGCKVTTEELSTTGDNLVRIINYKEFEILDDESSLNIKEDKLLYRLFIIRNNQGNWERGTGEIMDSTDVTYRITNDETKNEKVVLQINNNCNGKIFENNEVACTDDSNSSKDITHYCIHSDRFIYGFEDGATTGGCKVTDNPFEYSRNIVEIIGNKQFKIIENILAEKPIEDKDDYILKKLFIISCDRGGNCSRGTAKVKDSIGYTYDIKTDETENEKMIVKIESSCDGINIDYSESCNSESIITNYCIFGCFILGYNKNNNNAENKGCNVMNLHEYNFLYSNKKNIVKITEYHKFDIVEASDLKIEEDNLLYRIFIVNCDVHNCERTGGEITDSTGKSFNIDAQDETKNSKSKIVINSSSDSECQGVTISEQEESCNNESITKYCILSEDNHIHGIYSGSNTCKVTDEEASANVSNVYKISSTKKFEKISDPSSLSIESDEILKKLFIVNCGSEVGSCKRGIGEVTDSTNYSFKIAEDEKENKKIVCGNDNIFINDDGKLAVRNDCTAGYYLMRNGGKVLNAKEECSGNKSKCKLHYCEGNSETCTEISTNMGYALYRRDGETYLQCNGTGCTTINLSDIQTSDVGKCGAGEVGKFVKPESSNSITNFCEMETEGGTGIGKSFIENSFSYYLLTSPSSDTVFKGNVLVRVGKNSIININDEGYYLDSKTSDQTLSNTLIHCDDDVCNFVEAKNGEIYLNKLRTNLATSLIECSTGSGCAQKSPAPTDGQYYLDAGEKLLIKCRSSGCDYVMDANGYYIYDASGKKLISCIEGTCEMINGVGYYINAGQSNSKQLINCGGSNCVETVVAAGTYENSGMTLRDKEILCTGDRCFVKSYANNYYFNNDDVKARCQPVYSGSKLTISVICNVGYYLLSRDSVSAVTTVSQCTNVNKCDLRLCKTANGSTACATTNLTGYTIFAYDKSLLKCATNECESVASANGYYVNGDQTGRDKLIKCVKGVCESVVPSKGYYINGGDSSKPIVFTDGVITEIDINPTNVSGVMAIDCNKNAGKIKKDKRNICKGKGNVSMTSTTEGYYLIKLSSGTVLGHKGSEVIVKIGNGAAVVVSNIGYYINADSDTNINKPILKCVNTGSGEGEAISKTDTIFKTDCSKSVSGGLITKSSVYKYFCPSRQAMEVDFSSVTEGYEVITLETTSTVFEPQDSTSKNVLVKYGKDSVRVVDMSDPTWGKGVGYFVNGLKDSAKSLIQCDGRICKVIEAPGKGYYLNSGEGNEKQPFISYDGTNVRLVDNSTIYNSCKKANDGGVAIMGDTINFCPTRQNDKSMDMGDPTTLNYYLVDVAKGQKSLYINSNVASPVHQKILVKAQGHQVTVVENPSGYYLNSGSDKDTLPVIRCIQGTCEGLTKSNFKITTSCTGSAYNLVYATDQYKFCKDSSSDVIPLTGESYKFISVPEGTFTPFTGEYEIYEGIDVDVLIRISAGAVELINKNGYYVYGTKVIKCKNGLFKTISTPTSTKVYFVNSGSGEPIIKCTTTDNCESTTVTADSYYPNYDEKSTVIYCETTESCKTIKPEDGYYIYDTDKTMKYDGRSGYKELDIPMDSCSDDRGGLLHNDAKKVCTGLNSNVFTVSTIDIYQLVEIKYSIDFPFNIDGKSVGDTVKILLKTTTNFMSIVSNPRKGYYLKSSTERVLIYCDNNGCEELIVGNKGYFLNAGDADVLPIIYCNGSNCVKKEITEADVVSSSSGCSISHLLLDANSDIKSVCLTDAENSDVNITGDEVKYYIFTVDNSDDALNAKVTTLSGKVVTEDKVDLVLKVGKMAVMVETSWESNKYKYYLNSGNNSSSKPLITCLTSSTTCSTTTGRSNRYFINGAGTEGKPLIHCTSKTNCIEEEAKAVSYYITGNPGNYGIIKCSDANTCEAIDISAQTNGIIEQTNCVNANAVLNSDPTTDAKLCKDDSENVVNLSSTEGNGYYLISITGEVSGRNDAFFTGNEAKSVLIKKENNSVWVVTEEDTYAIPNGTATTNYVVVEEDGISYPIQGYYKVDESFLKCDGSSCTSATFETSCNGEGILATNAQGKTSLCKANEDSNPIDITGDSEKYYLIETTGTTVFGDLGKKIIKVGKGSAFLVSNPKGVYLDGGNTDNKMFIQSNKSLLLVTDVKKGYYLNGHGNTLFYCENDSESCVTIAEPRIGYYYNNGDPDNIIACKQNGDVVKCKKEAMVSNNCSQGNYGKINQSDKTVCNGGTGIDISAATEYFYIINNIVADTPFSNPTHKALVRIGKYSAVMVTPGEGYYYITTISTIMKCTGTTVNSCTNYGSLAKGYYLQKEGKTVRVIGCTYSDGYTCTVEDVVTKFTAGKIMKDSNDNKYKYCHKVNTKETKTEIIAGDTGKEHMILPKPTAGDYSSVTTNNILLLNGNNAVIFIDAPTGAANYKGYYINNDKNKSSFPLIKFEGVAADGGSFSMVSSVSSGYYESILEATDGNKIIVCDSSSSDCLLKSGGQGYYINEGDKEINTIIKCNGSTCTGITVTVAADTYDVKNADGCSSAAEGKLLVGTSKFCIDDSTALDLNSASEALYLVNGKENSAFPDDIGLLRTGNQAIVLQEAIKGYYLNGGADKDQNPVIKYNGSTYSTIASRDITGRNCTASDINSFVGGLIMDENRNIYICLDESVQGKIQIKREGTTTYHQIFKLDSGTNAVLGTTGHDVLVRKGSLYVNLVADAASDLVEINKLYVDSMSHVLKDSVTYTECATDQSVTQYTISSNEIESYKACDKKCDLTDLEHPSGCKIGYYLARKDNREIIVSPSIEGDLYECTADNQCKKLQQGTPTGYLVNNGMDETNGIPFILCTFNSIGEKECKLPSITGTETCVDGIGHIYKKTESSGKTTYKICLDKKAIEGDDGIAIDPEAKVSYFVSMSEPNIFTRGRLLSYAIVDFNHGNITIRKDSICPCFFHRKYKYTDANNKIEESVVNEQSNEKVYDGTIYEFEWIASEKEQDDDTTIINYYLLKDSKVMA
ncbi:hypothetical protein BCR32DRAFT_271902 [Anaeromyces robustus]|uniref:Scaffoldin n=1 Tax=Anaeromyces robustus TaxID=1754192 RepID=A0A1Y1WQA8_9FUNG|nr:hypothetical protein BCR32DRAFT_271902 [Anaeromyces robustus]|eukprot:ORX75446.1 hypothetical protein BCR32DRAFT_271902 [Anaeromyces robustus]